MGAICSRAALRSRKFGWMAKSERSFLTVLHNFDFFRPFAFSVKKTCDIIITYS